MRSNSFFNENETPEMLSSSYCSYPLRSPSGVLSALALFWASQVSAQKDSIVEVSFPSFDGFQLEGTLRLPSHSPDEPFPGVVFIHGSGPNSRDQPLNGQLNMPFGFDIPVFAQLAESLKDAGIAVLTYDKRTCGQFNSCNSNSYPMPAIDKLTVDDFVEDAKAAVNFLSDRPQVQSNAVVAVGHSQGGQFIPQILEAMPDQTAGGVMLAGPFRPIDEVMEYMYRNSTLPLLQETMGLNETQARQQIEAVDALAWTVEGLKALRAGKYVDPYIAGIPTEFWQSWLDLADEAKIAAAAIEQPLGVFGGDMDWNVPPFEAYAWADYLEGVGADVEMRVLDGISHALNYINLTSTPPVVGTVVHESVTSAISEFVFQAAAKRGGTSSGTSSDNGPSDSSCAHVGKAVHLLTCSSAIGIMLHVAVTLF